MDGINSQDSGALGSVGYIGPSVDAISEVKLLVSNYSAEYGGRTGGQFTITTKNGTNQFHGTAYYYWRHEQFNANEWFNNKLNVAKPRYRFNNPGGTVGGPLIIPGTNFNKSRTKLFFFFLYDYTRNKNIAINTFGVCWSSLNMTWPPIAQTFVGSVTPRPQRAMSMSCTP